MGRLLVPFEAMDELPDYVTGIQVVGDFENSLGAQSDRNGSNEKLHIVVEDLESTLQDENSDDNVIENSRLEGSTIVLKSADGIETTYVSSNHNGSVYMTPVVGLKHCGGEFVSIAQITDDDQAITEQLNDCDPSEVCKRCFCSFIV